MKIGAIIGVFSASLIFAALFAVGGAGIYGSPFAPSGIRDLHVENTAHAIYAAAILVGPLASLLALIFHKRLPYVSGVSLVLGAVAGVFLGLVVESNFRYVWGKVFLIVVWLPMSDVGAKLLLRKSEP